MGELSLNLPVVGEKDTTAEPKVTTALSEIQTQFNGKVAETNLEAKSVSDSKIVTNRALLATNKSFETKTATKAEIEAGVELSATRPVFVTSVENEATKAFLTLEPNSVKLARSTDPAWVFPGQKLKAVSANEPNKITFIAL